jgi:hypothetical protein
LFSASAVQIGRSKKPIWTSVPELAQDDRPSPTGLNL